MIPASRPERRGAAPGPSWTNLRPDGATLTEHDVRYLAERGVDLETAKAAGYWSARKPSETPAAFSSYMRRRVPTLVAPHLSPDGETVGYQKHDLHPVLDKHGEPIKWMSPKGARLVLSVHPWKADEVRHGTGRLWMPEGLTRMHALTARGEVAVSYAGCHAFKQDGAPLRCFEHVNLRGRLVLDAPDADYRTNKLVHDALMERVAFLESRGARVLVVSVPVVNGDEHAGLDDYLAACGDLEALVRDARPFVPLDVGRERLKKDDRLRQGIGILRRSLPALETRKSRECAGYAVARFLVEDLAPTIGKPHKDGVKVAPGMRRIASGVRVSLGTASSALEYLEHEAEFLKTLEPARGPKPAVYVLLYPSGGGSEFVEHMREQGGAEKESREHKGQEETSLSQRDSLSSVQQTRGVVKSGEKVPALRNSKLVHTWARKNGRRVVVDSDYFRRYGKKHEAIIRYILERGDPDEAEIHEKFGSRSSRLRDFRRTFLKPMLDDGVLVRDGASVRLAPDWPEALERVRERTDEEQDNRLQDRKYADQSKAYRLARNNKTDPTPELAGPEKVAEIVAAALEREEAASIEEQRRKVGMTAEVFIYDRLQELGSIRLDLLRDIWRERGGNPSQIWKTVRRMGCKVMPLPEYGDGVFVFAPPETERKPAEVVPINPDTAASLNELEHLNKVERSALLRSGGLRLPPKVDGVYKHGPLCECEMCESPTPIRYASAYAGSFAVSAS